MRTAQGKDDNLSLAIAVIGDEILSRWKRNCSVSVGKEDPHKKRCIQDAVEKARIAHRGGPGISSRLFIYLSAEFHRNSSEEPKNQYTGVEGG